MATPEELLSRLRKHNRRIQEGDPKLAEEVADVGRAREELARAPGPASTRADLAEETIALKRERPVLAIKNNEAELVFKKEEDSVIWKERLKNARPLLEKAIRAVGRIELKGHSKYSWVGTGWLVSESVLVTNRHVAKEFAMGRGEGFVFRPAWDGSGADMSADVDFLKETESSATLQFHVKKPLHIEDARGPDLAFFEVEVSSGSDKLAAPIPLASRLDTSPLVATIGYPARDSRIPDQQLMLELYGELYDKKRLAPGAVTAIEDLRIQHNCTTLGGNSGSVVVSLDTGEALGLHFGGIFLETNFAVRADYVKNRLDDLRSGRVMMRREAPLRSAPRSDSTPAAPPAPQPPSRRVAAASGDSASITIPLTVTVTVGTPWAAARAPTTAGRPRPRPASPAPPGRMDDSEAIEQELRPEEYLDRKGYVEDFIDGFRVPLPVVERERKDVLSFQFDGKKETVLRYEHFSVVMSRSRRLCFFSAVNIDGAQSKKTTRSGWLTDSRILKSEQIQYECYGAHPKFSRGHMTRREDPAWGPTPDKGNRDSMHVTNATPQMQAFNAPIWLGLEDYALQNARKDAMKISVFTGPYLEEDDPVMYGVRIPVRFWKIIAFVHDETGDLCATGYVMSQDRNLDEEHVFGEYYSPKLKIATQEPIRLIETEVGISFGDLASRDPMAQEALDAEPTPLQSFSQIRFF